MPITTRNVKLQIQIWVYMQSRQRIHHRHEEHQLSCLPKLAVNADLFPVVARHGNVVTFGTEAEKSDKRKYVFVFKITNGVVCVQPPSPPLPSGKERGRLCTSYIGERNQGEKIIFLQVMENLPTYWKEVKRKSNKNKTLKKSIIRQGQFISKAPLSRVFTKLRFVHLLPAKHS